jgi:hypothetical protein
LSHGAFGKILLFRTDGGVAVRGRIHGRVVSLTMPGAARTLTSSERDWLRVRSYLAEHRHGLAVAAAGDYPPAARIAGTPLLAAPRRSGRASAS